MKIGYARVSTKDQNLALQLDALEKIGVEKIFKEKRSGKNKERPELQAMLAQLRPGDIIYIYKLDRLGRSLRDLIDIVTGLDKSNVSLVSITDQIDTTTPAGKLFFHIFASISEFVRDLIVENTNSGLKTARARGRVGGRPGLSKEARTKALAVKDLYDKKTLTVQQIAALFKIGRATVYRYIDFAEKEAEKKSGPP